MHRLPTAALALGTLALTGPALGQPSFENATNYPVGTQPSGVTTGDFNGDGFADLATTVDGPDRVATLLSDGSGGFAAGPSSILPNSSSPQDLVAGDLDGDGDMDLAVAVRDPQGSVIIMLNAGNATFTMGTTAIVGERPRGLSIGDIDGDGDMDLAVANRDSNNASVLRNNGGGTFSVEMIAVGGETRSTTLADFDGDGDRDLAVSNSDNRSVHTYTNNGGSFSAGPVLSVGGIVRPDGVTSADLDGDGDNDIATAVSDQTLGVNQAMVFLNSGTGVFSGPFGHDTGGTNTSDIVAADLDCDGMMDLATSNQDSNNISILENLGNAVFGPAMIMAAGTTPEEMVAADLDGDGDSDLATANRDSNNISVFLNNCTVVEPCGGDVNGDGFVDVIDLTTVILEWGPNPGSPADLDGNGIVNVQDLTAVILGWGTCP